MGALEVHDLPAGRLFINKTDIIQVIFYGTDSHRIQPGQAIVVDQRGHEGQLELVSFLKDTKGWEHRKEVEHEIEVSGTPTSLLKKYKIDPEFFYHPDTYRLSDAFKFASEHKGKFSVLIIRDNSSYITKAGLIGGRGDVMMASVIAKALKYNYGDNVTVYMKVMKGGEQLVQNNPYVDKVFIDMQEAEDMRPDIKFSVNDLEFKVEMKDIERQKDVTKNRASIYLSMLDLPLENKTPIYLTTKEEDEWAKKELTAKGFDLAGSKPIIGVQLKGSNLSRTWMKTEELVKDLKKDYQVLILDEMKDELFVYTLRQSAALMKQTALIVTPNSFFFHLAGAMKHRCITLFGSVDSKIWVEDYEKCIPIEGVCPFGSRKCWWTLKCLPGPDMYSKELSGSPACLDSITVGDVRKQIASQLHPKRIGIILLTYDCLASTKKAVDSIRSFHDYELFVIDNASTDGTVEWLKKNNITFVSKKLSVTQAQNVGFRMMMKKGNFDYYMLLNNDVILSSTYLDTLVETLDRRKCAAVTGRVIDSNECSETEFSEKVSPIESTMTLMVAGDFSAILFSKEILEKVGAVDEIFSPRYQEDEDFLLRIRLADGEIIRTFNTTFYHHLGTTQEQHSEEKKHHELNWNRNVARFKTKWKFDCYAERGLYANLNDIKRLCPDWKEKIFIPLTDDIK
jgi:GT2 family glycosyltransferase/ADP-heptose:LPS heptosyltransferase